MHTTDNNLARLNRCGLLITCSKKTYDEWPFAAITFTYPQVKFQQQDEPEDQRQDKAPHHHKVEETCTTRNTPLSQQLSTDTGLDIGSSWV